MPLGTAPLPVGDQANYKDFEHQTNVDRYTNSLSSHNENRGQTHAGPVFIDLGTQRNSKGVDLFRGAQAFGAFHVDWNGTGARTGAESRNHDT